MFPVEFSVPGNTMFPVKFSDAWKMPKLLGSENSTGNSAFPGRFLWISWGILKKLFAVKHCKFLCVLYKILPRRIGPSHIISFEKLNKLNNSMKNHFFFIKQKNYFLLCFIYLVLKFEKEKTCSHFFFFWL